MEQNSKIDSNNDQLAIQTTSSNSDVTTEDTNKVIKIVNVKKNITDIALTSTDELSLMIDGIIEEAHLPRSCIDGFMQLSKFMQSPIALLLIEPQISNSTTVLSAILSREIINADPAVLPVVLSRGQKASNEIEDSSYVRTRPSARIRAVNMEGNYISIAAEEPINIVGFVIEISSRGSMVFANTGKAPMSPKVYITNGSYSISMLAAVGSLRPQEGDSDVCDSGKLKKLLQAKRFEIATIKQECLNNLLNHIKEAAKYYFGNIAVHILTTQISYSLKNNIHSIYPKQPLDELIITTNISGPTWRTQEFIDKLKYFIQRLLNISTITNIDEEWMFDSNSSNDLYRIGAFGIPCYYALIDSVTAPQVENFIELASVKFGKQSQIEELTKKTVQSAIKARIYVTIIEEKFGNDKKQLVYDALRTSTGSKSRGAPGGSLATQSASVQINDPEIVLAALSKTEREIVNLEYENKIKEWNAFVGNNCPHIAIALKLRRASSAELAAKLLESLSKYFIHSKKDDEWIMCKNCGFRVICPHVKDKISLEVQRLSYDEIRTKLTKYAIKVRGLEKDVFAYYCKICSEKLADVAEEDKTSEIMGLFGQLDSAIKTKIWAIAINAVKKVRFSSPIDEKQFANAASAAIYPLFMKHEEIISTKRRKKQQQSILSDEEDIDARTHLSLVLFVYAYILDLTQTKSNIEISFDGIKAGSKASSFAEKMLIVIIEEYRGIISQIEDITLEFLKLKFTDVYRIIYTQERAVIHAARADEELILQLTIDYIYKYAITMAKINKTISINTNPTDVAAAKLEFETAIGNNLPNIIKMARDNNKDPTLSTLYHKKAGMEIPHGIQLEFLVKGPNINLYANIYEPSTKPENCIQAFYSFKKIPLNEGAKLSLKTWFGGRLVYKMTKKSANQHLCEAQRGAFYESYRLFTIYTKAVVDQESYDKYKIDLLDHRVCEDNLRIAQSFNAIKSYYDFKHEKTQQFTLINIPITYLYDENGIRHDWSKKVIYHYKDETGDKVVKGGPNGVKKARDEGIILQSTVLVDLECPICKLKLSNINSISKDKVTNSLRAISELDSFYIFYESRCPLGGLHDWNKTKDKCIKCEIDSIGVKAVMAGAGLKNQQAREYYDKYSHIFAKERALLQTVSLTETLSTAKEIQFPDEWQSEYTNIVKTAELGGVNPSVIEAIGNMESREYIDIVDGKNIPPPPDTPSDPRIYSVDAEIRLVLADYSSLQNISSSSKIPMNLQELFNAVGVPKHEYAEIKRSFPDIATNYKKMFYSMLKYKDPATVYAFTIDSLCKIILEISSIQSSISWIPKLAVAFAKQELQTILKNQKMFAKPTSFNWSMLDNDDNDYYDDVGDVGEDVLDDIINNDTEGTSDPFSGEGMDYDTSEDNPNNEPN